MNKAIALKEWVEEEKHFQGQHNQKRHGWRFSVGLDNARRRAGSEDGISQDFLGKTTPEKEAEAYSAHALSGGGLKKYGGMVAGSGAQIAPKFLEHIQSGNFGNNKSEVIEYLKGAIKSETQRHDEFLERAARVEKNPASDKYANPASLRQSAAGIMGNVNGYKYLLRRIESGKDYLQDAAGKKTPIIYGKYNPPKPKKTSTPRKYGGGNSSKVDPNLARRAIQLAGGDKQAAYSRVVQLTALRPGFDAKDLLAWFNENGY